MGEPKKMKKEKKEKDPNAPKKPAGGAFGVFMAENREKIVKSLPEGFKVTEVMTKAGEQWKALPDADKQPYIDKYKIKQEAYEKAMAEYKKGKPADAEEAEEDEEEEEEEE